MPGEAETTTTVTGPDSRFCGVCRGQTEYAFTLRASDNNPDPHHVLLCATCGLLFVGDVPSTDKLKELYASVAFEDYYSSVYHATTAKAERTRIDLDGRLSTGSSHVSLLDVGCGFGHLLRAVRERHPTVRLVGHEFDQRCASECRRQGFEVTTSELGEVSGKFSIITMLDVAEHVADAAKCLADVRALLEDGGLLYLHTPRRCIWDTLFLFLVGVPGVRRLSLAWLGTRVSVFHLRLWTDEALRRAVTEAGFTVTGLDAELELSWPVERYTRAYLGNRLGLPSSLVTLSTWLARVLFVRARLLRNKAIVTAEARVPQPRSTAA